jgi:hypothetical protein
MTQIAMVDIELKSDHGDWDCVFVDEEIASSPAALIRFVREWGEQHHAHWVWFKASGARSAATLDLTLHGAQPVTVTA